MDSPGSDAALASEKVWHRYNVYELVFRFGTAWNAPESMCTMDKA